MTWGGANEMDDGDSGGGWRDALALGHLPNQIPLCNYSKVNRSLLGIA